MRFPEKCTLMLIACVLALALAGCDEDEGSAVDVQLRDPYHAVVDGALASGRLTASGMLVEYTGGSTGT